MLHSARLVLRRPYGLKGSLHRRKFLRSNKTLHIKPYKISDGKAYLLHQGARHGREARPGALGGHLRSQAARRRVGGTSWQNPRNWSRRHARGAKASGKRGDREEGEISDGELSMSSAGSVMKKIRQGLKKM